ncbi:hypothetical protein B0O99DRAFT_512984 [Bisporella sp. PMI_857]|nr:hypothetical protein B0O99DRAFT_512984 [Bisporella sp. PMI_857]
MADSCIICMEELDVVPDPVPGDLDDAGAVADPNPTSTTTTNPGKDHEQQLIALIKPCGHVLHDECLRQWSQKANSCPICRHNFNLVEVLDKVGGNVLSDYEVEDKKQVHEFDPAAWIADNEEEEEEHGMECLICDSNASPEVLLICEGCESPYHTYCLSLDGLPSGSSWFCMACQEDGIAQTVHNSRPRRSSPNRPRTRATILQTQRRIRTDTWLGAWDQISSQVHNAVGLDLDFSDDDQQHMSSYRRHRLETAAERAEHEQWRRRLEIAARQGAASIFRNAAPLLRDQRPSLQSPMESPEEARAWSALEKAKEMESSSNATSTSPRNRKRTRGATISSPSSPVAGPSQGPERKQKRPRTRRVLDAPAAASSSASPMNSGSSNTHPRSPTRSQINTTGEPSFLSSLLKEVETTTPDIDDENRHSFAVFQSLHPQRMTSPFTEFSSPAASPSPPSSRQHSPGPLSATPPPHSERRPGSPLPLTSHITPRHSHSEYSPSRPAPESNEGPSQGHTALELRQPRPRRPAWAQARSPAISPARANMSQEAKEGISKIVKSALGPHWKAAKITKEQYAEINRDVSRKLYEVVSESNATEDQDRFTWEKIAATEVAAAVKSLKA